jgi:hypothetical protein
MATKQQRQQQSDEKTQDRAKGIYKWALENKAAGKFKRRDLPGPNQNCMTERALEILVSRGLLHHSYDVHGVSHYALAMAVDPKQIIAIAPVNPAWRGVKMYRVPLGVAAEKGGASDLQKYAIGEIVSC